MTWPFKVPENKPSVSDPANANPDPAAAPPAEKSAAEMIAESLKPLTDGFSKFQEAMDARLKTLEDQTKPREPKPQVEPNAPVSVLDDENVAFAQRLTPVIARQLELESRVVKNDIKAEYQSSGYGELWAKFEKDINATIDGAPLVTADGRPHRGDPQFIRNVVDMIFGRAARAAGMQFDGKSKGFFLETGANSDPAARVEADGLTDTQRRVVQRMGIPLDQAKKVMSKLQFVQ
jgi:hypothetical protein